MVGRESEAVGLGAREPMTSSAALDESECGGHGDDVRTALEGLAPWATIPGQHSKLEVHWSTTWPVRGAGLPPAPSALHGWASHAWACR